MAAARNLACEIKYLFCEFAVAGVVSGAVRALSALAATSGLRLSLRPCPSSSRQPSSSFKPAGSLPAEFLQPARNYCSFPAAFFFLQLFGRPPEPSRQTASEPAGKLPDPKGSDRFS